MKLILILCRGSIIYFINLLSFFKINLPGICILYLDSKRLNKQKTFAGYALLCSDPVGSETFTTYLGTGILVGWPPMIPVGSLRRCLVLVVVVASGWIRNQVPSRRVPPFPSYELCRLLKELAVLAFFITLGTSFQSSVTVRKQMSPDFQSWAQNHYFVTRYNNLLETIMFWEVK